MDIIALANEIENRYRRYLKTSFYFKDPVLRASFEDALNSGHLTKGPFLEATPVFKRSQAPENLFPSLLGFQPDDGFLKAVNGKRPLYFHQEQAIEAVCNNRNVIVATGTGSGKTESFLYPILLHLYREFQEGELQEGVRALILYPMNALANDQRERLGELCKELKDARSPFRFTFGQYVGETPEDENDFRRHARDHIAERGQKGYSIVQNGKVVHGELVLRCEMRKTPPHILLTNYSMLEYMLIRPEDSPLLDEGRARWWTFLVLDEAHQYRGTRGTEMAMLLRRLKQRLREGGRSDAFRCIATSATLAGGEQDKAAVARFASDLFGEEFHPQDVILGKTEPIPEPGQDSLSPNDYELFAKALDDKSTGAKMRLLELAAQWHVALPANEGLAKSIARILQRDKRSAVLRCLITGEPTELQEAADQVFADLPPGQRVSALSQLVRVLMRCRDPSSDAPLLSARYHLFLRSLEGAFVSYWPDKKVFLDRKAADGKTPVFEVALCRECGQHYFIGPKGFTCGKLLEATRDPSHVDFGVSFIRPVENMRERDGEESSGANDKRIFQLCVQCGEMQREKPQCGHDNIIPVVVVESPEDEDKADRMPKCDACGYTAAGCDAVRGIVYGADGPHAVIATTLCQFLPEKRRKVLAFADGRQEAAFFAWYFGDSYKSILSRNLILKTVKSFRPYFEDGISLYTVADKAFHDYRDAFKMKEADDEARIRTNIWRALYREFLTEEQRISLQGVGLIRWSIKWPHWFRVPELLTSPPWFLTEAEARDLLFLLLETMRFDKAVDLRTENGVSLSWHSLDLQGTQTRFRIGDPKGQKCVRRWDGKSGKRAWFLAKILMSLQKGVSEPQAVQQAVEALRQIWDALGQCDETASSNDRLLLVVDDGRRLNPDWWRVHFITCEDNIFQCDTCGRLQTLSVHRVCPRRHCPGTLNEVRVVDLAPNHYRLLYKEDLPGRLRVEEHTAQLEKEKAREFQREFKEGKIHLLSCSTTFELGVDLGDLDTVFLRNVPPEVFNYAQRIGRAGRRSGFPGFAITYCRRSPHDLYHFAEPRRLLNGRVRPPTVSLRNPKIVIRHVTAVALSRFFRAFKERFKSVAALFKDLERPSAATDFKSFLYGHQAELEESLRAIVPLDVLAAVGLDSGEWVERVAGKVPKQIGAMIVEEESRFSLAEAEVSSDYASVIKLEEAARTARDYATAEWAQKRANTIASEDVLSFLSRKAVIPKYGFPVDVVELDTQRTQQNQEAFEVLLQRDLSIAISEFAPTSKLIANKKEWTSFGLKRVAGKEWPSKLYKRCLEHNVFLHWRAGEPEPPAPCGDRLTVSKYIIPHFGFVTDRNKPKDPKSRSPRAFTTRPYFAGSVGPEPSTINMPSNHPLITLKKASPGFMVVLCEGHRGEGFYVCTRCGAGFRRRQVRHKTPYGQDCRETLEQVSLGHEFVTDVLQIQFHPKPLANIEPIWFAYSLAYAIVEGAAEVLEVPSTDLNVTVAHPGQYFLPPIILYDNVPGGAGLVAWFEEQRFLKACLESAHKRVSGNCGCDENTSCYGCLRSYKNQFAHQYLKRGPVMHYLETLFTTWHG